MSTPERNESAAEEPSFELLPDPSEREELLTRLAQAIATAGYERFVSAPILLPDSKFFPDRWTTDSAGVHRLTKRLLRYAGLGDLGVDMIGYEHEDAPTTGHHTGIAGWFAGVVDGRCQFGFDERHLETTRSSASCATRPPTRFANTGRSSGTTVTARNKTLTSRPSTWVSAFCRPTARIGFGRQGISRVSSP